MLNLKWIINNQGDFNKAMKKRNIELSAEKIINLDKIKKTSITKLQELQSKKNILSKKVGILKLENLDTTKIVDEINKINEEMSILEKKIGDEKNSELYNILVNTPNILQECVHYGINDNDNKELEVWGEKTRFDFEPKEHFDIGINLGLMDFEQSTKICGSRSTGLFGNLALLERAISNFFLDFVSKYGYIETSMPPFVKENAMFGTGNLPKFSEDAYVTTNGMWLIPTSEVSITNIVSDKILKEEELPLRFTSCTSCFRSEAGSAGKDTKGMLRQHHFKKVEMVSITKPEDSIEEHDRMSEIESKILQALKIPYRTVLLCSGDTGFASSKTYDHEVWLPGQGKYREISSCSNCWDFQARRMNARYRKNDGKIEFLHTLNGSALAIGRTIIAIMENYQKKDGSFVIPQVLVPYMNGIEIIKK